VLSPADVAVPMTFSFTLLMRPLTASVRRCAMADGLTFSCSVSTSLASSARVRSMSRRISSGDCVVVLIALPPGGP
jgi:hypothetical protein